MRPSPPFARPSPSSPNYAEAHSNLGNALKDKGQLDEAIAAFRQAIALRPDYAEAHSNLGIALGDKGNSMRPSPPIARPSCTVEPTRSPNNLGIALAKGQLDEAIAAFRQAIAARSRRRRAHSNLLYTLHFHPGYRARPSPRNSAAGTASTRCR